MVKGELLGSMAVRRPSVRRQQLLVNTLEVTVLIRFSSNLVRMFVLMKSRSSSNMGHVGSKSRSRGQIKGKPREHSSSHIFDQILIKLDQNVCLNDY